MLSRIPGRVHLERAAGPVGPIDHRLAAGGRRLRPARRAILASRGRRGSWSGLSSRSASIKTSRTAQRADSRSVSAACGIATPARYTPCSRSVARRGSIGGVEACPAVRRRRRRGRRCGRDGMRPERPYRDGSRGRSLRRGPRRRPRHGVARRCFQPRGVQEPPVVVQRRRQFGRGRRFGRCRIPSHPAAPRAGSEEATKAAGPAQEAPLRSRAGPGDARARAGRAAARSSPPTRGPRHTARHARRRRRACRTSPGRPPVSAASRDRTRQPALR